MEHSFRRHALALAVAAMGMIDLVSALASHPPERVLALTHLVPTAVLDTSRTFTLLAGVLLVLAANGLRRGKRRAFVVALLLCAVSVPVNLLKAFDFEEATVATALMFLLGVCGEAFVVKSRALSWRAIRPGVLAVVLSVLAYSVIGCWIVELRYAPGQASFARAFAEAGYQLWGLGQPVLQVSREHHVVRWFLGSISVVSATLLAGMALAFLRPATYSRRHRVDRALVRDLFNAHGDSTVAAFALAPDVDHFFSANRRAVIAYHYESDVLLAIGDPIGPEEEHASLLIAFESFAREHDWQFAFYQARPECLAAYRERGWRAVHIGEDPMLSTRDFTLQGGPMGDVRRSVNKLSDKGLEVRVFEAGTGAWRQANDRDMLLEQLRAVSQEWLRGKQGGENGFCMSRFDPAQLSDVRLAIAWTPATRRVEAFCTWNAFPARKGWALDLMRRRALAPTGVMELLVVRSMEHARAAGDELLSLSLSALARVDGPRVTGRDPLSLEDPTRAFLIEHLSRFYDFQGLFRWKRKFDPVFEDRYLVFPTPVAVPAVALALIRAQRPGGLLSYRSPSRQRRTEMNHE